MNRDDIVSAFKYYLRIHGEGSITFDNWLKWVQTSHQDIEEDE